MTIRRLALTLAACATTLVATGPAAGAATWTQHDAAHDVTLLDADATDPDEVFVRDRTDAETDVRRLVVRHAPRVVRATFHLRDLRERAGLVELDLRTPAGDHTAYAVRTLRRELVFVERTEDVEAERVRCPGRSATWDPAADTVTVVVPRSCLGAPAWVRASGTVVSTSHGFRDDADLWVDDAGRRTADLDRPHYGPRVRRG